MNGSSRETILNKVRQALFHQKAMPIEPDFVSEIYHWPEGKSRIDFFSENFTKTKAQLFHCKNEQEAVSEIERIVSEKGFQHIFVFEEKVEDIVRKTKITYSSNDKNFEQADLGITTCESMVARTGSILLTSATAAGRRLSIFPHHHLVIAYTSQIHNDISDALQSIKGKYNQFPTMVSLTTGPSRTADIEKTLVLGAHGPKELLLILIHDAAL